MGLGVALFELLMGTERNGTESAGLDGMANVCGAGLGWAARRDISALILLDMEPGGIILT